MYLWDLGSMARMRELSLVLVDGLAAGQTWYLKCNTHVGFLYLYLLAANLTASKLWVVPFGLIEYPLEEHSNSIVWKLATAVYPSIPIGGCPKANSPNDNSCCRSEPPRVVTAPHAKGSVLAVCRGETSPSTTPGLTPPPFCRWGI